MNKFIQAVKHADTVAVQQLLQRDAKWIGWSEESGKNALHYLCGLPIADIPHKAEAVLQLARLLLASGMDLNSVHRIPDDCGFFPATPLWYAYTRGRNERLYAYLLGEGADPDHCMYAIAWNDDAAAAHLFQQYGAKLEDGAFLSAFLWKRFTIAEWFLRQGVDVNVADSDGNTAIYYAVKRKYKMEHVQLLLHYGADVHQKNKAGVSARDLAVQTNRTGSLRLMESPPGARQI